MRRVINKKYLSISEVSALLDINPHVIRYWDSKLSGISTRLGLSKQRHFNSENCAKLREIKKLLYKNGKNKYSLDIIDQIVDKDKEIPESTKELHKDSQSKISQKLIKEFKEIRESLNKLLES